MQDANFGHESSVAVQTILGPNNSHGAELRLRAMARIQVHRHYKIVMGVGVKAKTVTSL